MRDQFLEQIDVLLAGEDPINVFRDAAAMGEIIHLEAWTPCHANA